MGIKYYKDLNATRRTDVINYFYQYEFPPADYNSVPQNWQRRPDEKSFERSTIVEYYSE